MLPATSPTSQKHFSECVGCRTSSEICFQIISQVCVSWSDRVQRRWAKREAQRGDLWWSDYCSGLLRNLNNWTMNRPSVIHSVVLVLNLKCSHGDGGQFVEQQAWNRTGDSSVSLLRGQGLPRRAKVRGFDFLVPSSWGCSSDLWPC